MLKARGLSKSFGRFQALKDLNITIEDGMLYGIIGPNGAGKTTLMRILAGLLVPDSGTVEIDGMDAVKHARKLKDVVGYVPDSFGSYDSLTVGEYMDFFAAADGLTGMARRKLCMELLGQVGLDDKTEIPVDTLSRGMQQRLCIARALIRNPRFLIMDEPTSGLDPRTRVEFRQIISEMHEQGKTLLISSHVLTDLSQLCTDLGIIDGGSMLTEGHMDEILRRIESSNPIKIRVLDGVNVTMKLLREDPHVRSVTVDDHILMAGFEGSPADEARLLQKLILAEIPVREFVREPGSLEAYFMQLTTHADERVLLKNDQEPGL